VYDTKHQVDETERDYWVVLGDFNEDFIRDKKEEPTYSNLFTETNNTQITNQLVTRFEKEQELRRPDYKPKDGKDDRNPLTAEIYTGSTFLETVSSLHNLVEDMNTFRKKT